MISLIAPEKHHYAADALRENPIPRLQLTLDHNLSTVGALFSPELAEALTHLTLCLLYSNTYDTMDSGNDAPPQPRWDDVLVRRRSSGSEV